MRRRDREFEGGQPVLAGRPDIAAVCADDGLCDIQPEAPALAVCRAALIRLVEAVEQQRQLLRVDGRAGVLHRDMRLRAVGIQPQRQLSALRAELDGVVHQIVDDLRDRIALRSCPERPIRQIHIDLKLLGVDLLLERNEHVTQHVAEVEADLARLVHALRLKPGDVQHIADKPRQPAHLAGNDLHIMLLLFGRDRPVEHSVDITADRRHRRFQLVGDVRNKLLTALLRFFKAHRHRIERLRKVGDLLGALRRDLYARAEVSVAEPPGRLRHLVQRADLRTRKERGRLLKSLKDKEQFARR